METLIGIVGEDFVLISADANAGRSIVLMKDDVQKIHPLDSNKLFGAVGNPSDRDLFTEYIQKNITLYRLRTGISLSTESTAHWTRRKLANALRSNPYQTDLMIGGVDKDPQSEEYVPSLYYMDYLASMNKVDFGVHGHGSNFLLSVMDKYYKKGMTREEALNLLRTCINELKVRFIIKAPRFNVQIVDKDGIHELDPVQN
uniref:Proteasome subunit beta n=1 Tax=Paramoeba aestuarina TaxID=180227 RepID=A0A7S4UZ36_9EUKA|mmetsp:Transcript_7896/g.11923  ORF Transcript_7896/g.11923 Transcript_7896/m.11923 type:complete len:201 (+) Transcript_7896:147-749(+)|eukprot:CAMPEP_0201522156 /NCGR_PEP_ID=MMETSP0161_2-20130828/16487_1 /ASSEMBLY_ACC=CAM_ASM_000251 /TAXON_ID=180227 /ORGANISM="Neoparamoeba aestuarina, Strain SoJaBio B1-5/56/2" /LENGTH=200 /DNA_ID=CAMNT_0047920925 /DNA_START=115 /DNA_END=717 /DNA_ORIENTATION=+